jgi:signal transduction histidine kinase
METGAGTDLPARAKRLQIDYSVLNLTSPQKIRFRYRLEGFDSDWIDAGSERQAIYSNLGPRKYVFRVEADNDDGMWAEPGAVWAFSVSPVYYQTPQFVVACVVLVAFLIWLIWRYRVRQMRAQFAMLVGERVRLSREIHDTLLQSLVGVALECQDMADELGPVNADHRNRFVSLRRQVEEYIREARQSIFDLRSPKLESSDLSAALRQVGQRATAGKIAFEFTVTGTMQRWPANVEQQLLRIGQEAVVNAIRHASASTIRMELHYASSSLMLRVADDGTGFDPETASGPDGHYGLVSMKERAENLGADFKIVSAAGQGTIVETTVPLSSNR